MPVTTHRGQAPNQEALDFLGALVVPPDWESDEDKERRLRLQTLPRETQLFFEAVFFDSGDEGLCVISGHARASRANRTFGLAIYLNKNPMARVSLIGLFESVFAVSGDPDAIALEPSIIVTDTNGEETAVWLIYEFERLASENEGYYREVRFATKSGGYRDLERACERVGVDLEAYIPIPGLNGTCISHVSESRFTSAEIVAAITDEARGCI